MLPLLLSISCSTAVLLLFKLLDRLKTGLFHPIIINYGVAFILGVFLSGISPVDLALGLPSRSWFVPAVCVGLLLITLFFVIGLSTQRAGIAPTTIATRMSVVIPILFSIFYYNEAVGPVKLSGILTALAALSLVVAPEKNRGQDGMGRPVDRFLPALLFLGIGGLESLMKLAQQDFIPDGETAAFTGASFLVAFLAGLSACLLRRKALAAFFSLRVLGCGTLLGAVNFGTIYFLIRALDSGFLDGSVLFAVNSIGIVLCSVLAAVLVFREHLSRRKITGVVLAVAAIALFMVS